MTKRLYIIGLVMFFSHQLVAQKLPDLAVKAYQAFSDKDYAAAKDYIDSAIVSTDAGKSDLVWHIRGFIYKDIYTKKDDDGRNSLAREEAVISFKNSVQLDLDHSLDTNNHKAIRMLAVSYYNDAVKVMRELDELTIDKAQDYYDNFKELILFLDPKSNFDSRDIDFYLAMATCYRKIYSVDRENREDYLEKSNEYCMEVLDIDSTNFPAHYSIAVNIYNKGAYKIEDMDEDTDIPELMDIQNESVESFERALGPMLKAYELDPDRVEVIKGLRGIYLSLNDEEKSKIFDEKLQQLNDQQ